LPAWVKQMYLTIQSSRQTEQNYLTEKSGDGMRSWATTCTYTSHRKRCTTRRRWQTIDGHRPRASSRVKFAFGQSKSIRSNSSKGTANDEAPKSCIEYICCLHPNKHCSQILNIKRSNNNSARFRLRSFRGMAN
jgi:hypothetical protein